MRHAEEKAESEVRRDPELALETGIPAAIETDETKGTDAESFGEANVPADAGTVSDKQDASAPEEAPAETAEVVGIRFRGTGKTYFFSPNGIPFAEGDHAIVETVRGVEYGDVTMTNRQVSASDIVQPLKSVLRKATGTDDARFASNCRQEELAKPIFLEKCKKHKLEMQLVDVEYTFDNAKLTFYFTADGRVDFRELVKDLASVFHTRIDLRQIGPREEARLYGGIGLCGRPICCKQFLPDYENPTIKMAKEQNLSLASTKISGLCGKLMCCLKFEQPMYEQESKRMPQPDTEIDTPKGKAVVLESSFLSEKVKVRLIADNSIRTFTTAELNGEPAPEKSARKGRRGPEEFLPEDSYAASDEGESREPEEGGNPRPERREQKGQKKQKQSQNQPKQNQPKQNQPKQNQPKQNPQKQNPKKQNRPKPSASPENPDAAARNPEQNPREAGGNRPRHRFNRPNNVRKKGPDNVKKRG
ncbi:MAG: stage 0 sporulation family protein [Clostridia bacterium]|nr:stage 0 sporulation family protein [Clostridia bacterium]